MTKTDLYPIRITAEILDGLRSAKYNSKIYHRPAYHQIPLDEKSKEITAFTARDKGMYQYKRMPVGLTNAPATFLHLIDKLITPDMKPNLFCYLHNIIIVTKKFDEHLTFLEAFTDKLNNADLTSSPDKCEFGYAEFKYLGFIVNEKGLQVDEDNINLF